MMSSGIVCGKFDKEAMLAVKASGAGSGTEAKTFGEALQASGFAGSYANRLNPQDYMAMIECHIEQGPVLEVEKKHIGVVEGVLGMVNYRICVRGQSDHAGTTPIAAIVLETVTGSNGVLIPPEISRGSGRSAMTSASC